MEIEKTESFKEVDSKVVKLDEATKPAEQELLDANESASVEVASDAPKVQKKKKTKCIQCKKSLGCMGEFDFFSDFFWLIFVLGHL